MKISEFILASTGLLVSCHMDQLLPAAIFGVLAIISWNKILKSVKNQEPEEKEIGGLEPWEKLLGKKKKRQ